MAEMNAKPPRDAKHSTLPAHAPFTQPHMTYSPRGTGGFMDELNTIDPKTGDAGDSGERRPSRICGALVTAASTR